MLIKPKTAITGMLFLLAVRGALAQKQTISARPGLVNYVEGDAALNGSQLDTSLKTPVFINSGDTFSTGSGKTEVLLMPGVFLRLGSLSEIRMLTPSLVNTRLELLQGEAIIEAVGIIRGSQISVNDNGAVAGIGENGLYRIRAGVTPSAAVYSGIMDVTLGSQTIKLGKNHQTRLGQPLRSEKMDLDEADELYAWSSVRSQYEAAASYQASLSAAASGQNQPGWLFFDLFDTWAWLPQQSFFSPFGWGFYPPGSVWRAPVVVCTVMRGGHWGNRPRPISGGLPIGPSHWFGLGSTREVPINPKHPPVVDFVAGTPRIQQQMRGEEQVSALARPGGTRSGAGPRTMQARSGFSPAGAAVHNQVRVSSGRSGIGVSGGIRGSSSSGSSHFGGSSGASSGHSGGFSGGGGASHGGGGGGPSGGGGSHK